jgi:hypothetical protein
LSAIHVALACGAKDVDARNTCGHDGRLRWLTRQEFLVCFRGNVFEKPMPRAVIAGIVMRVVLPAY